MRFPKRVASSNWFANIKAGLCASLMVAGITSGFGTQAFAADDALKAAAQSIIQQQEQALVHDDAEKAFSFAAPNIQMMMRSPEGFMAMVQQGYAPVYRHRSFEFGESEGQDGIFAQKVRIIDDKGKPWDALYMLKQFPDGVWRITGCVLSEVGTDA